MILLTEYVYSPRASRVRLLAVPVPGGLVRELPVASIVTIGSEDVRMLFGI